MKVVVVGLGVQGRKRRAVAGDDVVATVDPGVPDAEYRRLEDVPLARYDSVLLCVPDSAKLALIRYALENGKHVLVEKPLLATDEGDLLALAELAARNGVACYTAYNHRFEPHFIRMRDLLESGELGEIYTLRMFYGNGTARLVRQSAWRDEGMGVLADLGSHLLDTVRFWLGPVEPVLRLWSAKRFENRAFDYVCFGACGQPTLLFEATLLSWRNDFHADLICERGSAHIRSLCKWGPSVFTVRHRVLPSGRPPEESITLIREDPTWTDEYLHFRRLCETGGTNLETDLWINRMLADLAAGTGNEEGA